MSKAQSNSVEEENAKLQAQFKNLPQHVAVIMDGNGRWARSRGLERLEGHRAGAKSVRMIVEQCGRLGIRYLTLFSFSTENWNRSDSEVSGLMRLFGEYLDSELPDLLKNNVRLRAVGDVSRLPFTVRTALHRDIERTRENDRLNLVLAISYGGREEILNAVRKIAEDVRAGRLAPSAINEEIFERCLWTADIPPPDLMIRTSGEMRISNFLLWQLAYSEIVVAQELWPDFSEQSFYRCLREYELRERRFGLTAEQIQSQERRASRAKDSAKVPT